MIKRFPFYKQLDAMDCGPTCLRMIAKFYGKHYSLQKLRDYCFITKEGVSLNGINEAALKIGFRTLAVKLTFEQFDSEAPLPCIIPWNQNHFVVVPPQSFDRNKKGSKIYIADPAHGLLKVDARTFLNSWSNNSETLGIALLLEPTVDFHNASGEARKKMGLLSLLQYLKPYKKYARQLLLGMLITSILSLIAPFLTQSIVDYGINQKNPSLIYLILIAQVALFIGNTMIEVFRGWILLHISTRMIISIISDFLIKLMKLPVRFFDTKMVGDITQRVLDHNRIEQFLTGSSLNTLFSLLNFVVCGLVLGVYSIPILIIFLSGSAISVIWIQVFQKRRSYLDYQRFEAKSDNQNILLEIISGMQEIKMNHSETTNRWRWERVQAKLFNINVKAMTVNQYQNTGFSFFMQLKNLLISFVAAQEVLNGQITLGMMLSITYISGQMNLPLQQLLLFFQTSQDAKISMERLNEVHSMQDEEQDGQLTPDDELVTIKRTASHIASKSESSGITLQNVSFQYAGPASAKVLNDINFVIPFGKVTAIVGASGSGKTTLMKLLLKFYEPTGGTILLGQTPLTAISAMWWRKLCGVVMSDGFIFSSTIANNISTEEEFNEEHMLSAAKIANIKSFIDDLPLGFSTKIGNTGNGISSGQKQRILIARAIYKEPDFIFLDEATSTLDANNEKQIIENLNNFFHGRTVVVIAHRLSTVKHADQIVVMEKGSIVEVGTHESLTRQKGKYFDLVKNQLELGN